MQPVFTGLSSTTITYGQSQLFVGGTFSAGSTAATGSVTITLSGNSISPVTTTALLAANGSFNASLSTGTLSAFPASPYTITYSYNAQDFFRSANATTSLTVQQRAAMVTAGSRSKTYGESVTFVGTEFVASGLVNGHSISSVTLVSAGAAAAAPVAGSPYSIEVSNVVGAGLSNYEITYIPGVLNVVPAATQLALATSPSPSVPGQFVTFEATVSSVLPAEGVVVFTNATTNEVLGSAQLVGSVGTINVPLNLLGSHTIVASYNPSSNFQASSPASNVHQVLPFAFQPGPSPGQYILAVGGTANDDNIDVQVKGTKNGPDDFQVHLHTKGAARLNIGNQASPGTIVEVQVYGLAGDDDVKVHTHKTGANVFVFGGEGSDKLSVQDGPAILIGGAGNDRLEGGKGPSLLVGGIGEDRLKSGGGNTALVGG